MSLKGPVAVINGLVWWILIGWSRKMMQVSHGGNTRGEPEPD
uniref:Uncharacterized protein n=1 Tax=Anguilla anguilla TaxID=7936 RepID=A0A0E9SUD3_ANGAN